MQIAAWESIDIDRIEVPRLSFEDQKRLVKAIAGVNALAAAGAVSVTTKWIQRSPKWFEARFAELPATRGKRWEDLYRRTVSVLEQQAGLATRVRSAGESFVTHNDVNEDGSNIHVPKDGDVVIFDWEGSTLSVPGADLGLLTQLDAGDRLMSIYVEEMAERGIDLDLDNIRFTAEVLWGFRMLQYGLTTRIPNRVDLALNMLSRHKNRARP
jgi:aminoglycoside phosphotransferase (APT) family kinase protein